MMQRLSVTGEMLSTSGQSLTSFQCCPPLMTLVDGQERVVLAIASGDLGREAFLE